MKKVGVGLVVAAFMLSAGVVYAAKCKVESVDGNKVTMTCDSADVKVGDNVTVKVKKSLEGC